MKSTYEKDPQHRKKSTRLGRYPGSSFYDDFYGYIFYDVQPE
jgi:hypothetical protein